MAGLYIVRPYSSCGPTHAQVNNDLGLKEAYIILFNHIKAHKLYRKHGWSLVVILGIAFYAY